MEANSELDFLLGNMIVCVRACVCVCVRVCACVWARVRVRVYAFSNDSCIGLGYDPGVFRTNWAILSFMPIVATGRVHISNS